MDSPISTTREDWIAVAGEIMAEEGVGEVKVLGLARRLGCSRSNFYWFFKDRDALLADLLGTWRGNTDAIVGRAGRTAGRISEGVLNIFDCWADPRLFDRRLDVAVRDWARRSAPVRDEVRRADAARIEAIAGLFARFGAGPTEALVRARTLYFMQIGYYALDLDESDAERLVLLRDYVLAFCGEAPTEADIAGFAARNGLRQAR